MSLQTLTDAELLHAADNADPLGATDLQVELARRLANALTRLDTARQATKDLADRIEALGNTHDALLTLADTLTDSLSD